MPQERTRAKKVLIIIYISGLLIIFVTIISLISSYLLSNAKFQYEVNILNRKMNYTNGQRRCPRLKEDHKSDIQNQLDEDQIMKQFVIHYNKYKSLYQNVKTPCGGKFFVGFRRVLYQNWTNENGNIITFASPFLSEMNAVYNYENFGLCTSVVPTHQRMKEKERMRNETIVELEIVNNEKCDGKNWNCFLCQSDFQHRRVFRLYNEFSINSYQMAMEFCQKKLKGPSSLAFIPHTIGLNEIYTQIRDHALGCHHIGIGNRVIEMIETIDEKILPYTSNRLRSDMLIHRKHNYNCVVTNVFRHYEWAFEDCASKHCFLCFY